MKQIVFLPFIFLFMCHGKAQDSITFSGQLSGHAHYNSSNDLPVWLGGRYIPRLNAGKAITKRSLLDFEVSANIFGNLGFKPLKKYEADGKIKPYRAWVRFSADQFEMRLGLQKINFGSAMLLRPLMWFDQLDPRDPLQLTDGVYCILGRYYFISNTNVWIWGLWGNKAAKMWETGKTNQHYPELGGRLQTPVMKGEVAFTYHFRIADTRDFDHPWKEVAENRFALDGKWDAGAGLWFEAVWINKSKNTGTLTNQQIINVGMDYTIGIGNGLTLVFEQLLFSSDYKPFIFNESFWFSGLACTYPVSIFDNFQVITYYDWRNREAYNFLNWKKQLNMIEINIMAYWNPENYNIPAQGGNKVLYGGKGIQLIIVYNH